MAYKLQTTRKYSAKQRKVKRKKYDQPEYNNVHDMHLVSPTV
jgi:hypothetical protein